MFCQTCCLHISIKPAASSVISVPIYQITLHHSPEYGDHCTHRCDNSNLILHTAVSVKLTQILGQFLQAFLFIQTGNTEQTATWNTVQHLQSQTDDNTSNSTLQFCYLLPTDWAMSDSWPMEDLCGFELRSIKLPAFTKNATRTSSSPLGLFFSFPGLLFNSYHLKNTFQSWGQTVRGLNRMV